MRTHDDELVGQVERTLRGRPGWSLQPSSSPGAPSAWCLVTEGEIDLSVDVQNGAICIYVMDTDAEVRVATVGELTGWLEANESASVRGILEPGEVLEELVHGNFTKWGRPSP
jgi:hypothetical protein